MNVPEIKELPNEYQLRERMLHFMERNHSNILNILRDWNERLQRGVPIDPVARYELFGIHIERAVKTEPIISSIGEYETKSIYLDVLINGEEPFQYIFAYCCEHGTGNHFTVDTFLIGDEEALLETYKGLDVQ